jgi:hypothetical protein
MNNFLADHEQRLFRVMLTMSGHNPVDFKCRNDPEGQVVVQGPGRTACYEREHWLSPFARDLYRGFFSSSATRRPQH